MAPDRQEALFDCLMRERVALLEGDFDTLEKLEVEKAKLLSDVKVEVDDSLREAAEHNLTLLSAAADGITSARRRLSELRDAGNGFATYGANGDRETERRFKTLGRKL